MKQPVTRLMETGVRLSDGTEFSIVHDFKRVDGALNTFNAALNNWLARTEEFTSESFVKYVKRKEPNRIFLTRENYDKITAGKFTPATKEEYDAENS